jgi:trk system potassium uptake protein TrkA
MGQQILVIGLGTFGSIVADELTALGHEVMGCDRDPRIVADLAPRITQAVELDAIDVDAIRAVGPADFDVAVVALDPSATILATMILEREGAKTIVARALSELDGEILRRVGADRVVYTDLQVATWIAHTIDLAGAIDFIRLSGDMAAVHLTIGPAMIGRTIGDVMVAAPDVRIVSLQHDGQVQVDPQPETAIVKGDSVLVVGHEQRFRALAR